MSIRDWIVLLLLSLVWGSSFLFIKLGVNELPPVVVVAGRLLGGALFLVAVLRWQKGSLPPRRLWPALALVALFNNVLPFILIAWGEQWVASGLASILNATTPLFSVVVATSFGDERLSWQKVVGVAIGFIGVVVLIGDGIRGLSHNTWGELAIIVASASYALGALFIRRWLQGGRPVSLAGGQLVMAFLLTAPLLTIPANHPASMPSTIAIGSVAALGLIGSGLAYVLYYRLIMAVGATRTLMVTYLVPLTAIIWGWLLLDETLSLRTFLGMGFIFSGILLVNRERQRPSDAIDVQQALAG